MKTAWDHLPNAVHMSRIVDSLKKNPNAWAQAYQSFQDKTATYDSVNDAWAGIFKYDFNLVRDTISENAPRPAYYSAELALMALFENDCAYMLDSDPGELEILAVFGNPLAILMLCACNVFSEEKKK